MAGFVGFMMIWAAINSWALTSEAWDPYPCIILLNLLLSMLAGLQGAILLIAANDRTPSLLRWSSTVSN